MTSITAIKEVVKEVVIFHAHNTYPKSVVVTGPQKGISKIQGYIYDPETDLRRSVVAEGEVLGTSPDNGGWERATLIRGEILELGEPYKWAHPTQYSEVKFLLQNPPKEGDVHQTSSQNMAQAVFVEHGLWPPALVPSREQAILNEKRAAYEAAQEKTLEGWRAEMLETLSEFAPEGVRVVIPNNHHFNIRGSWYRVPTPECPLFDKGDQYYLNFSGSMVARFWRNPESCLVLTVGYHIPNGKTQPKVILGWEGHGAGQGFSTLSGQNLPEWFIRAAEALISFPVPITAWPRWKDF